MRRSFVWGMVGGILLISVGCNRVLIEGEQAQSFNFPSLEADWVRNGEPLEYEGKLWYPQDDLENLVDSEMYPLGQYKDVPFFCEKQDVRPFNRLYTKFARNKFRLFLKKENPPK